MAPLPSVSSDNIHGRSQVLICKVLCHFFHRELGTIGTIMTSIRPKVDKIVLNTNSAR